RQFAAGVAGGRPSLLSLEGLRRRAPGQAAVLKCGRIPQAFSLARAAATLHPHSPLRPAGGTQRRYQAGTLPATARRAGRAVPGMDRCPEDLGRARLGVDRTRPALLPALPRPVDPTATAAYAASA